jgi:membrane protein DedA with SNARE-associated domain
MNSEQPTIDAETTRSAPNRRVAPPWLPYILIGCVIGLYALGFFTNASAPELLKKHPLTLMALSPRYRWMVLAAPRVDAIPFYVVGIVRLLLSDPIYFMLGWFYRDKAVRFLEDSFGAQSVKSTRGFFDKASWLMASFFAGPIVCVLAGASGIRPRKFFTLNVIGTVIITMLLRLFSDSMKGFIDALIRFNARNTRTLMIITVVSSLLVLGRVARKQFTAAKNFTEDD